MSSGGAGVAFVLKERPQFFHDDKAKYLAEFVGTFFLVFTVGCNVHTGSIGAAASIGAILMVMVYALGPVSGGHLNPAVTVAIGLSGRGKISLENMFFYILAQLAGGVLGAINYWIVFNNAFVLRPVGNYSNRVAAWSEILYTMALCYVVLNVATTTNQEQGNVKALERVPNSFYGLAIGLTVTSAAIAVGPISGCSLNPAVSLGAMTASQLAHGYAPVSMLGLYTLAPLFGACLATLFFYFVQGGLTGMYEYELCLSRVTSPALSRTLSPVQVYREPDMPKHCQFLKKGQIFYIPHECEHHKLFLGLSWKIEDGTSACDIDAACVKFNSQGRLIEGIYFSNPEGFENRRTKESIVRHMGDDIIGKLECYGVPYAGESQSPHSPKTHGRPPPIRDNERVQIKSLSELRHHQERCTYMFFVINVFSAVHKFENMKEMTIRVVDEDRDNFEICRFSKSEMTVSRVNGNGFVLGVLCWRPLTRQWAFQVIDESFDIKEHGTYREFVPKLQAYVRQMEGYNAAAHLP